MKSAKVFSIFMLAVLLTATAFTNARAADGGDLVTGTIQSIVLETDVVTNTTTVVVYFIDGTGLLQKARLSLASAISLGLFIPDPLIIGQTLTITDPLDPTIILHTGVVDLLEFIVDPLTTIPSLQVTMTDPTAVVQVFSLDLEQAMLLNLVIIDASKVGTAVEIDPTLILESETYSDKVSHLAGFFGTSLGLTPDQLATYEGEGIGFGVLAEAFWLTVAMGGDATLLDQILIAKSTSDFSAIVLPDGTSPSNWGQFRKALLTDPHQNLGRIVSGKADPITPPTAPAGTGEEGITSHGKPDNTHGHDKMKENKGGKD